MLKKVDLSNLVDLWFKNTQVNLWFKYTQELQDSGYNITDQFEKSKELYIGILVDVIQEKNMPEL